MLFTKRAEYGVFVLLDLAHLGRGCTALTREVAERRCLPAKFVPQVVAALRAQGWIRATPGPGGGIGLCVDPETITVGDVVRAMESAAAVRECVGPPGPAGCPTASVCVLRPVWNRVQEAVEATLAGTTLADLVRAELALADETDGGGVGANLSGHRL